MHKLPDEIVVQTLYGPEIAMKTCNTCAQTKDLLQFYPESISKRGKVPSTLGQVRDQCIECWLKYKGKT